MLYVALGVVVAICSGATQSLGLTMQRKAHLIASHHEVQSQGQGDIAGLRRRSADVESANNRPSEHLQLWRLGVFLFIVANLVGSSVQIVALPLIVLCPLQAVGLVFNSVWASLLLGEPFTRRSLQGTVLVVIGAGLIAIVGAQDEPDLSLGELQDLFARPRFLKWMALSILAIVMLVAVSTGSSGSSTASTGASKRRKGIQYGVASGILSAHSLLMAKVAVGLIVQAFKVTPQLLLTWQFWLIVLTFASFAIAQLFYVNYGLRYISTSMLYPLVFCVYNVTSMVNGFVFYGYQETFSPHLVTWVSIGTIILLAGVLLISSRLGAGTAIVGDNQGVAGEDVATSLSIGNSERLPLLGSHYTSLETLNPNISNPDAARPPLGVLRPAAVRHATRRVLSKEQAEILSELVGVVTPHHQSGTQ